MSNLKPAVAVDLLNAIVAESCGAAPDRVRRLAAGEIAQAWRVDAGDRRYVLRLALDGDAFAKDSEAWRRFARPALPIPQIHALGETDGMHWALSEFVAGRHADDTSRPGPRSLFAMLDAIHATDIGDTHGFGWWSAGEDRDGRSASWVDHIWWSVSDVRPEHAGGRAAHRRALRTIERLLAGCPDERRLVHGDYGSGNVLVNAAGEVQAVLDWGMSGYGDPLRDIAWIAFWSPDSGLIPAYREHLAARGGVPDHFEDRVRCYAIAIGLASQRFFAGQQRRGDHRLAAERTAVLIERGLAGGRNHGLASVVSQ